RGVGSGVSFWTRAKCEAGVALGQWITGASIETIDEMEIRPGLVGSLHDHRGSIRDLDDHHRPKTPRSPPDRRSGSLEAAAGHVSEPAPADKPQRPNLQTPGAPVPSQVAPVGGLAREKQGPRGTDCRARRRRGSTRPALWPRSPTIATRGHDDRCRSGYQRHRSSDDEPATEGQPEVVPWSDVDLV